MAVYAIVYDLNKEKSGSSDPWVELIEFIESLGPSIQLSKSAYAVESALSTSNVYGRIKKSGLLDINDRLIVIKIGSLTYGQLPQKVIDWLEERGV